MQTIEKMDLDTDQAATEQLQSTEQFYDIDDVELEERLSKGGQNQGTKC